MGLLLAICAFLCACLSLGIAGLVWKAGVLDLPDHRSLHVSPTPRGGGIGVLAAAGLAGIWLALLPVSAGSALPVLALVTVMAGLGVADDVFGLPSKLKFAVMVLAALALAGVIGVPDYLAVSDTLYLALPFWVALPGAALFLFVVINAVNFMDGSDSMLAAGLVPGGAGLVIAGLVTGQLDASFAGAALAGALCAGALYAGAALAMAGSGFSGALWLAPLFILPFLADVLLTMARRAAGGRLDLEAHREHLYQRLISSGWSHLSVAGLYAGASSVCVAAGLLALQGGQGASALVFVVMTGVLSGLYLFGGRYADRRAVQ